MFFLYLSEIMLSFLLAYYTSYQYLGPSTDDGELANWISYLISDGDNLTITFLLLVFIFAILDGPWSYIKKVVINSKVKRIQWQKIAGIILFILIFDIYLYIYLKFSWYLFIPLVSYLIFKFSLFFLLEFKKPISKR